MGSTWCLLNYTSVCFHFGCWEYKLLPALCELQILLWLSVSSVFSLALDSFLSCMLRLVLSQGLKAPFYSSLVWFPPLSKLLTNSSHPSLSKHWILSPQLSKTTWFCLGPCLSCFDLEVFFRWWSGALTCLILFVFLLSGIIALNSLLPCLKSIFIYLFQFSSCLRQEGNLIPAIPSGLK